MKRLLLILTLSLTTISAEAQIGTLISYANSWRHAFSRDGVSEWRPEFTVRYTSGFFTDGPALTGGVRVDNKRTLGFFAGQWTYHIDKNDCSVRTMGGGTYMRRYIHLGKRDIVALYSDVAAGLAGVYRIDGGFTDPDTGIWRGSSKQPGDIVTFASWQPGIRVRIYNNLHIFAGPTVATKCYGFHVGLGF